MLVLVDVLGLGLADVLVLVLGVSAGATARGFSGGIGSPSGAGSDFRGAGSDVRGVGVGGFAPGDGYGITSPGEVGHGTGSCLSLLHAARASATCT